MSATAPQRGSLLRRLDEPMDAASLAAFRILFGLLMAFAMIRFLANGWVEEFYVRPTFFFSYEWFPGIKPLPSAGMHGLFVVLAVLALFVAAGFYYHLSAALFFVGFTYVELIDKTTYLNHYYLISLLSALMIFLPASRLWSIDAWLNDSLPTRASRGERDNCARQSSLTGHLTFLNASCGSGLVPGWTLYVLRFQIAVVYLFAGLAKLNSDWLFEAQPLRIWLAARNDLPLIGSLLGEPWVAYVASWLGAGYDLTIVGFLCHRKTRGWAFAAVVVFHVATWVLFRIGIFPGLMILSALLFFPAAWPRRFVRYIASNKRSGSAPYQPPVAQDSAGTQPCPGRTRTLTLARNLLLASYASFQLYLPLRHYLQSESSTWTGRGFNWAWRVMLVEKSGHAEFRASDSTTGRRWRIRATEYVTPRQAYFMAQDPSMVRALGRHIAADLRAHGHREVQVFADAYASINGRTSRRLLSPKENLAVNETPLSLQDGFLSRCERDRKREKRSIQ